MEEDGEKYGDEVDEVNGFPWPPRQGTRATVRLTVRAVVLTDPQQYILTWTLISSARARGASFRGANLDSLSSSGTFLSLLPLPIDHGLSSWWTSSWWSWVKWQCVDTTHPFLIHGGSHPISYWCCSTATRTVDRLLVVRSRWAARA